MFIVDVSYLVILEGKGNPRKREKYLIDAVNVTDSEVKIIEFFKDKETIDFKIMSSTLCPVTDVVLEDFDEEGDKIYQGTAVYKEDNIKKSFLSGGSNIEDALDKTSKYFQTIPITSIKEIKLIFDSELVTKKTGMIIFE